MRSTSRAGLWRLAQGRARWAFSPDWIAPPCAAISCSTPGRGPDPASDPTRPSALSRTRPCSPWSTPRSSTPSTGIFATARRTPPTPCSPPMRITPPAGRPVSCPSIGSSTSFPGPIASGRGRRGRPSSTPAPAVTAIAAIWRLRSRWPTTRAIARSASSRCAIGAIVACTAASPSAIIRTWRRAREDPAARGGGDDRAGGPYPSARGPAS